MTQRIRLKNNEEKNLSFRNTNTGKQHSASVILKTDVEKLEIFLKSSKCCSIMQKQGTIRLHVEFSGHSLTLYKHIHYQY